MIYYYLAEKRLVFLILEEPEAHLYPDSQKCIAELLGLFSHAGNPAFITMHSPYILGTFNNLLNAHEIPERYKNEVNQIIDLNRLLPNRQTQAFFVKLGQIEDGMEKPPDSFAMS
jgi:predicted ATPase